MVRGWGCAFELATWTLTISPGLAAGGSAGSLLQFGGGRGFGFLGRLRLRQLRGLGADRRAGSGRLARLEQHAGGQPGGGQQGNGPGNHI